MLTEINLKDSNGKMEYTILCDLELGKVMGWNVNLVEPLPIQTILNIPMLMRQASSAPCGGGAQAASATQQSVQNVSANRSQPDIRTAKRIRIGKDGTPIVME